VGADVEVLGDEGVEAVDEVFTFGLFGMIGVLGVLGVLGFDEPIEGVEVDELFKEDEESEFELDSSIEELFSELVVSVLETVESESLSGE